VNSVVNAIFTQSTTSSGGRNLDWCTKLLRVYRLYVTV